MSATPPFPAGDRGLAGSGCAPQLALAPTPFRAEGRMAEELPPNVSVGRIAEFGALIGDPARIAMLVALLSHERLSASALAECAGVTPQTASGHLGRLVAGGLVKAEPVGRHRLHSFASKEAGALVRQLYVGGTRIRCSPVAAGSPPRLARRCTGHLAGQLATQIAETLVDATHLEHPVLRPRAVHALRVFGIANAGPFDVQLCRDWTQQTPHLSGALGHAILERSLELGWVRPSAGSSALIVTRGGIEGFRNRFGILLRAAA